MSQARDSLVSAFLAMRGKLLRSVAGIVQQSDLEDVVQETFLRIQEVNATAQIRNPESFIYKTARNLALDHVKRAERRLVDGVEDLDEIFSSRIHESSDSMLAEAVSREEFSEFCLAVSELPEQCRRVFVLRKVYGFSQREIAKSLSISESTVEKHVAKGLRDTYQRVAQSRDEDRVRAPVANISRARARRGL